MHSLRPSATIYKYLLASTSIYPSPGSVLQLGSRVPQLPWVAPVPPDSLHLSIPQDEDEMFGSMVTIMVHHGTSWSSTMHPFAVTPQR